jgi:hypothetical protein
VYRALHQELRNCDRILTTFRHSGAILDGVVTASVSGNRPHELVEQQRVRYAAYDGRVSEDLEAADRSFMPLISDNWTNHFTWMDIDPIPPNEQEKLRNIVTTAHSNGQRVRFWARPEVAPAREEVWQEWLAAQVDYINTDNLDALQQFLVRHDPVPAERYFSWDDPSEDGRGHSRRAG